MKKKQIQQRKQLSAFLEIQFKIMQDQFKMFGRTGIMNEYSNHELGY